MEDFFTVARVPRFPFNVPLFFFLFTVSCFSRFSFRGFTMLDIPFHRSWSSALSSSTFLTGTWCPLLGSPTLYRTSIFVISTSSSSLLLHVLVPVLDLLVDRRNNSDARFFNFEFSIFSNQCCRLQKK